MQSPTVGRTVHFYPSKDDPLGHGPLAAIVSKVWSDTCVNLAVFDGTGVGRSRTSVLLHKEGNEKPSAAYAEWPPIHQASPAGSVVVGDGSSQALPPLSDAEIETKIRDSGADIAPRVAVARIDYLHNQLRIATHHFPGTTVTVAVAVLPNGFAVGFGQSAAVSSENFNAEIGRRIATDNALKVARENLWELEGYHLKMSLPETRLP